MAARRFLVRGALPLLLGPVLGACSVLGVRSGTEQPAHAVLERHGPLEIRRYAPRLAAETMVEGGEEAARSAGFRRLAAYIFGANRAAERIAMTAPVGQQRIAMTAPVAQDPEAPGRWRVRFFMPARWTAETLPVPQDPAVTVMALPEETIAVLRFSGLPTAGAVQERRAALLGALEASPWQASGEVQAWFYDPPWTVPPARRNEVAVPVTPRRPG